MKTLSMAVTGLIFSALSGQVFAEAGPAPAHHIEIGKKVYERAFGRGCGACHDISSNPQLVQLIHTKKLDRKTFGTVLKEGKGGMPKAIDQILELATVKTANLSPEQAIDAVFDYLKSQGK